MEIVLEQLDVLKNFTERLEKLGIQYMLNGSMALSSYSTPRSTLDIDIVAAMSATILPAFIEELEKRLPHSNRKREERRFPFFDVQRDQQQIIGKGRLHSSQGG